MAEMTIVWDALAKESFKSQIRHIAKDSIQNAEHVKNDILTVIDGIPQNPEKFPIDKFKLDNDGSFRAFEKHSLRVAYLILRDQVRILRVKHVKQEPRSY
jgi:plasmid stabilization system protein ParE